MLPPLFAYAVCLFHITPCRVFSYRISEKRFKGHLHHNYFICFHRPQTLCKSFYDYSSCHYLCIPLYKIMNVVSRLFLFLSVFSVLLSSNMLLFYFRLFGYRLAMCIQKLLHQFFRSRWTICFTEVMIRLHLSVEITSGSDK